MPEGRMLNRRISEDSAVNELSSDSCRLAFTWTLPFLDRDGRVTGHPGTLRNKVFPRRTDITDAQMEAFIAEWNELDLAVWYRVKRDLWLEFPAFRKNQHNWRYDREAPSAIPASKEGERVSKTAPTQLPTYSRPTPDLVPTYSRLTPANELTNEVINKDYFVKSDKNYEPPASSAGPQRPAGQPEPIEAEPDAAADLPPSMLPLHELPDKLRAATERARLKVEAEARRKADNLAHKTADYHAVKPPANGTPYAARGAPPERDAEPVPDDVQDFEEA